MRNLHNFYNNNNIYINNVLLNFDLFLTQSLKTVTKQTKCQKREQKKLIGFSYIDIMN